MKKLRKTSPIPIITKLLILGLAWSFGNCDDAGSEGCPGKCTIIQGKVFTENGSMGISNLNVKVTWTNLQHSSGGVIRTKATTTTARDGSFALKFLIPDDEVNQGTTEIEFLADQSKFLVPREKPSFYHIKQDTTILFDYFIPKKAFLKWKAINLEKIGKNDYFFTEFLTRMGGLGQYNDGSSINWARGLPSTQIIEVAGSQPLYIRNVKSKTGIITTEYDTLNIQAGQTAEYTFDFNQ